MKSILILAAFIMSAAATMSAQSSSSKVNVKRDTVFGSFNKVTVTTVKQIEPIKGEFKQFGFEINPSFNTCQAYTVCPASQKPFIMVYDPKKITKQHGAKKAAMLLKMDNGSTVKVWYYYSEPIKIVGYEYMDRTTNNTTVEGDTTLN